MAICYPCLNNYVDIVQLLSKSNFLPLSLLPFHKSPHKWFFCDRFTLSPSISTSQHPTPRSACISCSIMYFRLQWCFIYPTEPLMSTILLAQSFWAISLVVLLGIFHIYALNLLSAGYECASVVNMRVVHFIANKIVSERIARVSCRHRYVGCTMRKLGTWNRMRLENFVPVWIYYHVCVCV